MSLRKGIDLRHVIMLPQVPIFWIFQVGRIFRLWIKKTFQLKWGSQILHQTQGNICSIFQTMKIFDYTQRTAHQFRTNPALKNTDAKRKLYHLLIKKTLNFYFIQILTI